MLLAAPLLADGGGGGGGKSPISKMKHKNSK